MIDSELFRVQEERENAMLWLINNIAEWPAHRVGYISDCKYYRWRFYATDDNVVFTNFVALSINIDDMIGFSAMCIDVANQLNEIMEQINEI